MDSGQVSKCWCMEEGAGERTAGRPGALASSGAPYMPAVDCVLGPGKPPNIANQMNSFVESPICVPGVCVFLKLLALLTPPSLIQLREPCRLLTVL